MEFQEKMLENLGIPCEVVLFLEFRKYCSIRYWKLPEMQTESFGLYLKRAFLLKNKWIISTKIFKPSIDSGLMHVLRKMKQ